MDPPRPPARTEFTRRLAIETPEHVVVELELAGVGSRMAAAVVDAIVVFAMELVLALGTAVASARLGAAASSWLIAAAILLAFLVFWGYFALFEGLNRGRTPGKKYVGIRVVMDTGHPVTLGAAAIRNLVRVVDAQPVIAHLVGGAFVLLHPQHKRLGDLVAGTIVVRDRPSEVRRVSVPAATAAALVEAGAPELSDAEFRVLSRLVERLDSLDPQHRARLVDDLATRFAARYPRRDPNPEAFLVSLHAAERERRGGRLAARAGAGAGRTGMASERFVIRKQESWEEFHRLATAAERRGLERLGPSEIPGFAARYREVAADLARARTYGVDPRVLDHLERIVTAGHNAIYGLRGRRRHTLAHVLLRELPAAVFAGRAYVLVAMVLFGVPAVAGYSTIRERPEAAAELLPSGLIARAETGHDEIAAGRGYAEAPDPYLPLFASGIVANNVQVAFFAFAFGITAGLGTVLVLVFNGFFLGAALGLFAEYGLGGWLLTFVAAHGVLELAAIFIAAGAGLVVARALVAPGDVRRRDALVLGGRAAIRMVGAAACLLVLAGTIEGFLSASDAPAALKLVVSAASGVLLALYIGNGRRNMTESSAYAAPRPSGALAERPRWSGA
jgi:uncharacterized membrane protein SpoIIM required for sporulation/uncharacterized RDD family membrane protein YckC